jgi:hypothetical protein
MNDELEPGNPAEFYAHELHEIADLLTQYPKLAEGRTREEAYAAADLARYDLGDLDCVEPDDLDEPDTP